MSERQPVTFLHPVLGQKCVVRIYGVGRVVRFADDEMGRYIEVRTYADGIARAFDPRDVALCIMPETRRCVP